MARPERHDVDYYPKYIKQGKTLFILESKYGLEGYGFFYKLLDFLGRSPDHHYCVAGDLELLYLSSHCLVGDSNKVLDMLEMMSKTGKIDMELWRDYRVIFSSDFVDSIKGAYKSRKNNILGRDIILSYYSKKFNPERETGLNGQETPMILKNGEKGSKLVVNKYVLDGKKGVDNFVDNFQVTELNGQETGLNGQVIQENAENDVDNPQKKKKEKKEKEKEKDIFENFRKKYPGSKRGLDTEFEDFKRKHVDWREVVLILEKALDNQIVYRRYCEERGDFVPCWKNLKTWLNQRCWEEEYSTDRIGSAKKLKHRCPIEMGLEKIELEYEAQCPDCANNLEMYVRLDGELWVDQMYNICWWCPQCGEIFKVSEKYYPDQYLKHVQEIENQDTK